MENRILDQFNSTIINQWSSKEFTLEYDPLNHRELFELSYHTNNSVGMRNIFIKLSQDENKAGSKAILYSNTKKFISIEALDDNIKVIKYFSE